MGSGFVSSRGIAHLRVELIDASFDRLVSLSETLSADVPLLVESVELIRLNGEPAAFGAQRNEKRALLHDSLVSLLQMLSDAIRRVRSCLDAISCGVPRIAGARGDRELAAARLTSAFAAGSEFDILTHTDPDLFAINPDSVFGATPNGRGREPL
jgi:hypothetical protein